MDNVNKLIELLENSDNIVFFGGAGVSTESGIPDFRSAEGLYQMGNRIPPEVILSHDFFYRHTKEFYDFYFKHMIYPDVLPNATHILLAKLEQLGKLKAVVTQNIDGLHQRAGSKAVFEMHGTVNRYICLDCNRKCDLNFAHSSYQKSKDVPRCQCGGVLKPDVVLYGEALDQAVIEQSAKAIAEAEVLIVAGSSLVVYPAAGFINYYHGNKLVLINAEATAYDKNANLHFKCRLKEVVEPVLEYFSK